MVILNKVVLTILFFLDLTLISCERDSRIKRYHINRIITIESLLDEMISFDESANYPVIQYIAKQTSSHDRRSIAPDKEGWFANDDGSGYERIDTIKGRIEKVLFEQNGPGVITRIWLSASSKTGTLRFYFDGGTEPTIIIPAYDMQRFPLKIKYGLSFTHTHYNSDLDKTGGNTFFLPIPYQKSCRITFEEPDYKLKIPRYYLITECIRQVRL